MIFYTIHCPKCNVLQDLMKQKNMEFQVIDDEKTVMEVADKYKIRSAPFAEIDGKIYSTKELQDYIRNF